MTQQDLSDAEIEAAFQGADFGPSRDHRKLLEQGVLKAFCGYHSGSTLTGILDDLGLVNNGTVTKKGKAFMFNAFYLRNY